MEVGREEIQSLGKRAGSSLLKSGSKRSGVGSVEGPGGGDSPPSVDSDVLGIGELRLDEVLDGDHDLLGGGGSSREDGTGLEQVGEIAVLRARLVSTTTSEVQREQRRTGFGLPSWQKRRQKAKQC